MPCANLGRITDYPDLQIVCGSPESLWENVGIDFKSGHNHFLSHPSQVVIRRCILCVTDSVLTVNEETNTDRAYHLNFTAVATVHGPTREPCWQCDGCTCTIFPGERVATFSSWESFRTEHLLTGVSTEVLDVFSLCAV